MNVDGIEIDGIEIEGIETEGMNEDIQGSVSVSRIVHVGADAHVNGSVSIGGDLRVNGYIMAPNLHGSSGDGASEPINLSLVLSDVSSLKTRMGAAEGRIDTLSTSMGDVYGHITNGFARMDTMSGYISEAQGRIASLLTRMEAAEGRIDTLSTSMGEVYGHITNGFARMDTMSGYISEAQGRIASLLTSTDTLSGRIAQLEVALSETGMLRYTKEVYNRSEGNYLEVGTVFYCASEKCFLRKTDDGIEEMPSYNKPDTVITSEGGEQYTGLRPRGDRIFQNGAHLYRYEANGDKYVEI